MKFTSTILFAAMAIVAAAECSDETYLSIANNDEAVTDGRPVIIPVLDNDSVSVTNSQPAEKKIVSIEKIGLTKTSDLLVNKSLLLEGKQGGTLISVATFVGGESPYGVVLKAGVLTTPTNGIATITNTEGPGLPTFTYTPNRGFVGTDRFGYTFTTTEVQEPPGRRLECRRNVARLGTTNSELQQGSDTNVESEEAVVTVTVTGVEETPVASQAVTPEQAVGTVRGVITKVGASAPGGPGANTLSALLGPVTGGVNKFVQEANPDSVQEDAQANQGEFREFEFPMDLPSLPFGFNLPTDLTLVLNGGGN
jgi:hypothetical protein